MKNNNKQAIYPGSFNPIHNGHIGVIKAVVKDYDHLYILVANNEKKSYSNTLNERAEIVKKVIGELNLDNITIIIQEPGTLTPNIAKDLDVKVIVRGSITKELPEHESQLAESYLDVNEDLYFHYIVNEEINITSTTVRKLVKDKKSIVGYVPESIISEVELLWKEGI